MDRVSSAAAGGFLPCLDRANVLGASLVCPFLPSGADVLCRGSKPGVEGVCPSPPFFTKGFALGARRSVSCAMDLSEVGSEPESALHNN